MHISCEVYILCPMYIYIGLDVFSNLRRPAANDRRIRKCLSRVRVVPLARNHRHVNSFRIGPLSCETYTLSDLVLLATLDLASILLSFFPSCLSVLQISLLAILLIYSRGYIIARNRQNPRSLSMVRACPRETRFRTGSRGQFGSRTLIRFIIIMLKVEILEVEISCG